MLCETDIIMQNTPHIHIESNPSTETKVDL